MAGRGSAPGERRGGRQKGTPNKITANVKNAILGALDDVGERKYLAQMAIEYPPAFMALLGKVLPLQVTGADGADLVVRLITYNADDNSPA